MWDHYCSDYYFYYFLQRQRHLQLTKKETPAQILRLHCTVNRTSYSSILNQMEQIVFLIAKRCPWDETSGISYNKKKSMLPPALSLPRLGMYI